MRCVGHSVAPSRSATVCRLSAAARAGPCAPGGSCAPGSALAAPGATARWKRLGRSTTRKRMAVVLGRQDGARRRRDMPGGRCHGTRATPQGKGAWPVRTAQMQRSGKTGEPPTPPWPKRPKLPQWAHRYNRGWEGRGRGLHEATHGPGAGVRRPGRQQPSRLAGFHCNNWHFPRWGSGNEGARLLRCNIGWSMCFLGLPSDEAGVSPRTGDAVAGCGSWPWRPPQCGFPRPVWQTRVPGAF